MLNLQNHNSTDRRRRQSLLLCWAAFCFFFLNVGATLAQTTTFTYQGRFTDAAVVVQPTSGSYEMQFKLFDTATVGTGTQSGATNLVPSVAVAGGIFAVQLDFTETSFSGANVFVEIGVRPVGSAAAFTLLAPRQAITSAPYAIRSKNAALADVSIDTQKVGGTPAANIIKEGDGRLTDARTPAAGSPFYVQNQNAATLAGDFKIGGTGAADILDAATQFNIGGNRVLSVAGVNNTFAGIRAGLVNSGGQNSFFGRSAGETNTTGAQNSFLGASAGQANTTGGNNSFFGRSAGLNNLSGNNNSFVGTIAGGGNTTGSGNSFVGSFTGVGNTTGDDNSFLGSNAGISNTAGYSNSFVGKDAGRTNLTGINNAFFGTAAGFSNTASDNAFFGRSAGYDNTTGILNVFAGEDAGRFNTTGGQNSFFGTSAGRNNLIGNSNAIFGINAGYNTLGDNNTIFGAFAGLTNTTGGSNSFFGYQANAGANNLTFATAVGAGAIVSSSSTVVLGRTSDTVIAPNLLQVGTLGAAGSTSLCRNSLLQISTCTPGNFTEKGDSRNAALDALQTQNVQMRKQLEQQQTTIEALKQTVCATNPTAAFCQK